MDFCTVSAAEASGAIEAKDAPDVAGLRVERLVGMGGMALVYAVQDASTGKRLALKTLRVDDAADAAVVSRFWREVNFAMRVEHPNVASVLGHGQLADGRPYALMELYAGCTLGELVRKEGPLELDRAARIFDQVLVGLEAVHRAGIVHRDLSPENVLIECGACGRDRVVLLDFGIAHEPGVDTGDGVTQDSRGAWVGTMGFMSPEQVLRGRAITTRSDLFVAAVLFYYALSGMLPFGGVALDDVALATVRRRPIPLRRGRSKLPRAVDVLLARALAKHPDARFADAAEMRMALLGAAVVATKRGRVGRQSLMAV